MPLPLVTLLFFPFFPLLFRLSPFLSLSLLLSYTRMHLSLPLLQHTDLCLRMDSSPAMVLSQTETNRSDHNLLDHLIDLSPEGTHIPWSGGACGFLWPDNGGVLRFLGHVLAGECVACACLPTCACVRLCASVPVCTIWTTRWWVQRIHTETLHRSKRRRRDKRTKPDVCA